MLPYIRDNSKAESCQRQAQTYVSALPDLLPEINLFLRPY